MKTSRYTEAQIIAILRQAEGGVPVAELCREHGMSNASFYKWRAKYGGMDADLSMQADLLKEALGKKSNSAVSTPRDGRECGGAKGSERCAGLPCLWGERDLLSLWPEAEGRERGDRRSAGWADRCPQDVGFWSVFPSSAQRQRAPMEPQAGVSDLMRAGTEPADQTPQAAEAGQA
jgi:putative transposase